jgi:hypothetical protein
VTVAPVSSVTVRVEECDAVAPAINTQGNKARQGAGRRERFTAAYGGWVCRALRSRRSRYRRRARCAA